MSVEAYDLVANLRCGYGDKTSGGPDKLVGLQAAKTIVKPPIRGHGERGGLLLVIRVRAQARETGSLPSEGCELGGYLDDVGSFPDLFDAAL